MIRTLLAGLLLLAVAAPLPAAPSLKEARERWLRGNYEEALAAYQELAKDAKQKVPAVLGESLALQSLGKYDEALAALDALVKDHPKDAAALARRAELLYLRGRWDDANKSAEAALAVSPKNLLARWVQAQLLRDRGDVKAADDAMRWFVRTYTERSNADDDIKDPDELLIVGLAGSENARWHALADQFQFILDEVYTDALKHDANFWPAEVAAGLLLLEKYNYPQAAEAFDKALKINPACAEALVGKGVAALQKYDIKDAESFAERALKINDHLPEALRLRADLHLALGDAAAALKELDVARKLNPRDERTLARIAVCHLLQGKKADRDALAKEVEGFDSKPAPF